MLVISCYVYFSLVFVCMLFWAECNSDLTHPSTPLLISLILCLCVFYLSRYLLFRCVALAVVIFTSLLFGPFASMDCCIFCVEQIGCLFYHLKDKKTSRRSTFYHRYRGITKTLPLVYLSGFIDAQYVVRKPLYIHYHLTYPNLFSARLICFCFRDNCD